MSLNTESKHRREQGDRTVRGMSKTANTFKRSVPADRVDSDRVGKRTFTLSEVECCPSAYWMEANANTHWFISHQMAKAMTIYMEEFWGKWPQ